MIPALLIDIGGVLVADDLSAASAEWSARLGISRRAFISALFGGNDDRVLVGRMSESSWWELVAERLGIGADLLGELQRDLWARESWDAALVARLRGLRGAAWIGLVSNAWPGMRTRMEEAGLLDVADELVLSCEVGYAKPDVRIFRVALARIGADPGDVLFIDDTEGHVAVARSLGMTGHVHTGTAGTLARIDRFLAPSC